MSQHKNSPLVTIVIPCYNHEKHVEGCIRSVVEQTYDNIELIIIDDGSRDRSVERIQSLVALCERRFKSFRFIAQENKGLCSTLNHAISLSQGKYYCTIASDDALLPNKVMQQVAYLEANHNCAAVFGGLRIIDDEGKFIRDRITRKGKYNFVDLFLVRHSLATPSQMIRLETMRKVGLYDPSIYIEDWYMWLKLAHEGYTLDDLGEVLAVYRRHDNNMSANLDKMSMARRKIIDGYKEHELYSRALGKLVLSSAMDLQVHSKSKSLLYLAKWYRSMPSMVCDKRFLNFLIKFLIPRSLIKRRHGVK
jgi:alpha-1,3-rhamnosyltransferase